MRATIRLFVSLAAVVAITLAGCGGGGGGGGASAAISATATTTAQSLTVGTAMTSFSPLTASGGATPYTYSYTGTLPAGLSFSTTTGAVTGIPTATYATANLVFSVQDKNNIAASTTSTVSFTVVANTAPCTSQTLSWTQNGQICSAPSGTAPSGQAVNLVDTTAPATGAASFTCTNGIWGILATPAPACAAPAIPAGAKVTDIQIVNPGATVQANVPVTFGQVFAQGNMLPGELLAGKIGATTIPLQVDVKATHADGSLRHAVISASIPSLTANQTLTMDLVKTTTPAPASAITPTDLTNAGFTASINITLGGTVYTASADTLLKALNTSTCINGFVAGTGIACQWLSGSAVNEWLVSAPLTTAAGVAHPHLTARFAIRSYTGLNTARVDVTVENDWAYEPNPQDFTYSANIVVGGTTVFPATTIKHYHHARWHKVFWWGTAPQADIKPNAAYLMASKAVPNYDQTIPVSTAALVALDTQWTMAGASVNINGTTGLPADSNLRTGPMGQGILSSYMAMSGGRPEIGPLPQWSAMYVLSGDTRAKAVTLGAGDLAGSWPMHYRDKSTGLPLSIAAHPYAGIGGIYECGNSCKDTSNFDWATTICVSGAGVDCTSPFSPDSAHQPSLAYLPYLITGDYYYLEELQFWANYNMLHANPVYRGLSQGYISPNEVRGQAWSLRTLGQTAYITPDTHPLKSYFVDRVGNNLTLYNTVYVTGNPNQLGVLDGSVGDPALGYHIGSSLYSYDSANTVMAPWQDDFFTWSVGYLTELGFTSAQPLLKWKAQFPIGRMVGTGFCWIEGGQYNLKVRPDSTLTPMPLYATFVEVYAANFGPTATIGPTPANGAWVDNTPTSSTYGQKYIDQACGSAAQALWNTNNRGAGTFVAGQMMGYAYGAEGYPSNMQPALAVAAVSGATNAAAAWTTFSSRPVKPTDYNAEPQFSIVPRY